MIIEGSLGVVRLELEWSVGEKEGRIVVSGTGQWRSCFFMASPELPKGLSILESSPRRGSAEFFGGSRKPGFSRPRDNWGAVIGWVRGFLGAVLQGCRDVAWASHPFFGASESTPPSRDREPTTLCDEKYLTLGLNAKHFTVTQLDIMNL